MNSTGKCGLFVYISFITILSVSLIDACTTPVFYNLRNVDQWGPVALVGMLVTFAVVYWLYRLWNQIIPNITNWKQLSWHDLIGLLTIVMIVRHLIP